MCQFERVVLSIETKDHVVETELELRCKSSASIAAIDFSSNNCNSRPIHLSQTQTNLLQDEFDFLCILHRSKCLDLNFLHDGQASSGSVFLLHRSESTSETSALDFERSFLPSHLSTFSRTLILFDDQASCPPKEIATSTHAGTELCCCRLLEMCTNAWNCTTSNPWRRDTNFNISNATSLVTTCIIASRAFFSHFMKISNAPLIFPLCFCI